MRGVRFRVSAKPHHKRRRRTLAILIVGAVTVVLVAQGGFASRGRNRFAADAPSAVRKADPTNPIVIENRKPGTPTWRIANSAGRTLQGFASATSVHPGERLRLYVSSDYPTFTVRVFRMGWYGGDRARLVWFRRNVIGYQQAKPTVDPVTNMVDTNWEPSLTVPVGDDWTTGAYLAKLVAPEGQASYVPFTVREGEHRAPIVFQASVTTWQAYNKWGGHSLYTGITSGGAESARERAKVVSFDRPYSLGNGAADFLGLELPLISWLEQNGYDVGYATDVDTHSDPHLLDTRKAFLSLGHDEYWSTRMRTHVEQATEHGTNLAFFGANAMFRHIRFQSSPVGPHRREVNYRSKLDPIYDNEPLETTVQWRDPPVRRPESEILGAMYECNPVKGDLVVRDPLDWLFKGTTLQLGDRITGLLGPEYDRVFPGHKHPEPLWVLFRTPVHCSNADSVQDTTFARFPSGAAVFDSGTSNFLCAFAGCKGAPADVRIQRLIRNLLDSYVGVLEPVPEPTPKPFSVTISRVGQVPQRAIVPAGTPNPFFVPTPRSPTYYYTPDPGAEPTPEATRRPRILPYPRP